jgi:ganglioside-induced differentiation-associated protein 1
MLELYHHGSSACAAKVRFALAEKELKWASHHVDILSGEQFRRDFLAINPKAVVPVLIHDGFVLPESTTICEYLEECFPRHSIYPDLASERALVRNWTKAVDEELHPACSALTYIVSHRHTILRSGLRDFESFITQGTTEGLAARTLKWQWIQHGIAAPGAAERMKLYNSYLHKMERALRDSEWLVANRFSMADIAMTPYVNRLAALSMSGLWEGGRLPRVAEWFAAIRARPTFAPSFLHWMPTRLAEEMRLNGQKCWPEVKALLDM